jgi:hypothetical protein
MVGVTRSGLEALFQLSEQLHREPVYERACAFDELAERVFGAALERFFDRASQPIHKSDLEAFEGDISRWLADETVDQRLFIACKISRAPAPAFSIGPVQFQYLDDFVAENDYSGIFGFDRLVASIRQAGALWMATVDVSGCRGSRVWEIGDTAVDLALASIQLVVPFVNSRRMARLYGRTVPDQTMRLAFAGGRGGISFANQAAGMTLGHAGLEYFISNNATILTPTGNRVSAYLTGNSPTPDLDRAWSDAAYWFHEGLAEPLDTVAIPKLETAIEILLRAESSKGSERRLLTALRVFYGREADELVNPDSLMTIAQFARRFVAERSRILHGTISTLHSSLGASRNNLAELVAGLVRTYAVRLDEYQASGVVKDQIDAFLDWVTSQRL